MDDRLQRWLDTAEITRHKFAFARAADDGDVTRMVARFTSDCTAAYVAGQPAIAGRDRLRAWYAERTSDVVSSSHHVSNVEVVFAGADVAHLRCYLYSWQRYADQVQRPDRHVWARYVDTWVRTPDGWYQSALVYLLAGEVTATGIPRVGEHLRSAAWQTGRPDAAGPVST